MDSTWLTLGILLVGVVTVVGGVLLLRLHAFLALVLGALFVGLLTPTTAVERHELEKREIKYRANERIVLEGSFRPGTRERRRPLPGRPGERPTHDGSRRS